MEWTPLVILNIVFFLVIIFINVGAIIYGAGKIVGKFNALSTRMEQIELDINGIHKQLENHVNALHKKINDHVEESGFQATNFMKYIGEVKAELLKEMGRLK